MSMGEGGRDGAQAAYAAPAEVCLDLHLDLEGGRKTPVAAAASPLGADTAKRGDSVTATDAIPKKPRAAWVDESCLGKMAGTEIAALPSLAELIAGRQVFTGACDKCEKLREQDLSTWWQRLRKFKWHKFHAAIAKCVAATSGPRTDGADEGVGWTKADEAAVDEMRKGITSPKMVDLICDFVRTGAISLARTSYRSVEMPGVESDPVAVLVLRARAPFKEEWSERADPKSVRFLEKYLVVAPCPSAAFVVVAHEYRTLQLRGGWGLFKQLKRSYLGVRRKLVVEAIDRLAPSNNLTRKVDMSTINELAAGAKPPANRASSLSPMSCWVIDCLNMHPKPKDRSVWAERMRRLNRPYQFILFGVDACTGFVVVAAPLENKRMYNIIASLHRAICRQCRPGLIRADNEFNNRTIKSWLNSLTTGARLHAEIAGSAEYAEEWQPGRDAFATNALYGRPYFHSDQGQVESLNGLWRKWFDRQCAEFDSYDWVNLLPYFQRARNTQVGRYGVSAIDMMYQKVNYEVVWEKRDRDVRRKWEKKYGPVAVAAPASGDEVVAPIPDGALVHVRLDAVDAEAAKQTNDRTYGSLSKRGEWSDRAYPVVGSTRTHGKVSFRWRYSVYVPVQTQPLADSVPLLRELQVRLWPDQLRLAQASTGDGAHASPIDALDLPKPSRLVFDAVGERGVSSLDASAYMDGGSLGGLEVCFYTDEQKSKWESAEGAASGVEAVRPLFSEVVLQEAEPLVTRLEALVDRAAELLRKWTDARTLKRAYFELHHTSGPPTLYCVGGAPSLDLDAANVTYAQLLALELDLLVVDEKAREGADPNKGEVIALRRSNGLIEYISASMTDFGGTQPYTDPLPTAVPWNASLLMPRSRGGNSRYGYRPDWENAKRSMGPAPCGGGYTASYLAARLATLVLGSSVRVRVTASEAGPRDVSVQWGRVTEDARELFAQDRYEWLRSPAPGQGPRGARSVDIMVGVPGWTGVSPPGELLHLRFEAGRWRMVREGRVDTETNPVLVVRRLRLGKLWVRPFNRKRLVLHSQTHGDVREESGPVLYERAGERRAEAPADLPPPPASDGEESVAIGDDMAYSGSEPVGSDGGESDGDGAVEAKLPVPADAPVVSAAAAAEAAPPPLDGPASGTRSRRRARLQAGVRRGVVEYCDAPVGDKNALFCAGLLPQNVVLAKYCGYGAADARTEDRSVCTVRNTRDFDEGEQVEALWENGAVPEWPLWYSATVVAGPDTDGLYSVRFNDGNVSEGVKPTSIRGTEPAKRAPYAAHQSSIDHWYCVFVGPCCSGDACRALRPPEGARGLEIPDVDWTAFVPAAMKPTCVHDTTDQRTAAGHYIRREGADDDAFVGAGEEELCAGVRRAMGLLESAGGGDPPGPDPDRATSFWVNQSVGIRSPRELFDGKEKNVGSGRSGGSKKLLQATFKSSDLSGVTYFDGPLYMGTQARRASRRALLIYLRTRAPRDRLDLYHQPSLAANYAFVAPDRSRDVPSSDVEQWNDRCTRGGHSFALFVFLLPLNVIPTRWILPADRPVERERERTHTPVVFTGRWQLYEDGGTEGLYVEGAIEDKQPHEVRGIFRASGSKGGLSLGPEFASASNRRTRYGRAYFDLRSLLGCVEEGQPGTDAPPKRGAATAWRAKDDGSRPLAARPVVL